MASDRKETEIGPVRGFFLEALAELVYSGATGTVMMLITAVSFGAGYLLHSNGWSGFVAVAVAGLIFIVLFMAAVIAVMVLAYRLLQKPDRQANKA